MRGSTRADAAWDKDRQALRRILQKLVSRGLLTESAGSAGGRSGGTGAVWKVAD